MPPKLLSMKKWWYNIQRYFFNRALAEAISTQQHKHTVINLRDAKTIGILYNSSNPDNDIIITRFTEQLKRDAKTVEILGFVDDKKVDHKADILVMNSNHINWCMVPSDEKPLTFATKNFDLLLCCFTEEILPLEYIAALSKARWRVGVYNERKTTLYDMMVNLDGKIDLNYLLQQMIIFLNKINYDTK